MIMNDDFSTKSNGWTQIDDRNRRTAYVSGAYEVSARAATQIIAFPRSGPKSTGDVLIRVDGRRLTGEPSHGYGLVCKSSDSNNLYRFNITSDGYYGIIKVSAGKEYPLQGASPSDAMSSTKPNQIQALCVSNPDPPSTELRLWVNGHELKTVVDSSPPLADGTRVGIYARDTSGGGTTWSFDNFQLWELEN